MIWTTLAFIAFVLAAIPCALLLANLGLYRPLRDHPKHDCPAVSVLIPARDEESNLRPTLDAVLANGAIDFEVIVLDDASADSTARIVAEYAKRDSRVRLEAAPPLPNGWCGKQHACHVLANLARNPLLVFLDADVRLAPNALVRLADYVEESDAHLVQRRPSPKARNLLRSSPASAHPFRAFGLSSAGHHATARFIAGMFRRLRSTDCDTAGCLLCVRRSRRVPRRNARRPKVAACVSRRWFPHRPVRRDRSGNVPNVSNQCGGLAWAEQERHRRTWRSEGYPADVFCAVRRPGVAVSPSCFCGFNSTTGASRLGRRRSAGFAAALRFDPPIQAIGVQRASSSVRRRRADRDSMARFLPKSPRQAGGMERAAIRRRKRQRCLSSPE